MKAIMISIRPEYVEKILNKQKIIEIRKTIPKCKLPCKVYIYCTKGKNTIAYVERKGEEDWWGNTAKKTTICTRPKYDYLNYFNQTLGRVVAEFTLNEIETINEHEIYNATCLKEYCCLTPEELHNYTKGKKFYAWHIDNLKIYNKPKDLSEFSTILHRMKGKQYRLTSHLLQRPPQSWFYVKELEDV